jgi:hypothetical protein
VNDFKQYTINYDNGTIPIGELPIGSRVMDPSWEWEFRDGNNYLGSGPVKPITWIVVAKNHYGLEKAHITLLSEKVIGRRVFDNNIIGEIGEINNTIGKINNSIAEGDQLKNTMLGDLKNTTLDQAEIAQLKNDIAELKKYIAKFKKANAKLKWIAPMYKVSSRLFSLNGCNHWGDSGTANATSGLRPWLNSNGIHSGEGFYRAFSESFKNALVTTSLPNREWKSGSAYSTQDKVFIPSTTELGDKDHQDTYQIGLVYPYFLEAGDAERIACREIKYSRLYFPSCYSTRSPGLDESYSLFEVSREGSFCNIKYNWGCSGVRPALNLKAECLVSEIRE